MSEFFQYAKNIKDHMPDKYKLYVADLINAICCWNLKWKDG